MDSLCEKNDLIAIGFSIVDERPMARNRSGVVNLVVCSGRKLRSILVTRSVSQGQKHAQSCLAVLHMRDK